MGNEASSLSLLAECTIDETPIVTSGDWTLHHAQRDGGADPAQLSVYIAREDNCKRGSEPSQLDLLEKNLKLYRHPKILRFLNCCPGPLSSSSGGGGATCKYLFTEKTSPLALVLGQQSALQVCLGLHDVIEALLFLHDNAGACHNNIALSSVLVTHPEGRFKLGGLEFVKKFDEVSRAFLDTTRSARHKKAVAPEEDGADALKNHRARDAYGIGVLIEDLFKGFSKDEAAEAAVPGLDSLLRLASSEGLQARSPGSRPDLAAVLREPIFAQDYLGIVDFLTALPLKSREDRRDFFGGLTRRLFSVPEETVAIQLAPLLLSRLVLLDDTAKERFLPDLLTCYSSVNNSGRPEFSADSSEGNPLLSEHLFKEHVTPILLKIFYVRDFQIRMVLLSHFTSFSRLFSVHVLEDEVLPQLRLGMRDTDDAMVAATLRALADLVPVLGARIVVSKNRKKVFSDGSPGEQVLSPMMMDRGGRKKKAEVVAPPRTTRDSVSTERSSTQSPPSTLVPSQRHSPIGAEGSEDDDNVEEEELAANDDNDNDAWDSWGDPEEAEKVSTSPIDPQMSKPTPIEPTVMSKPQSDIASGGAKKFVDADLSMMDIKVSKSGGGARESGPDFFSDMEPVIPKAKNLLEQMAEEGKKKALDSQSETAAATKFSAQLSAVAADDAGEDGWGSEGDWGGE